MLASDTLLQNRYLVVRPIGKGGMGAVYLAKDQRLRSTVALKETFFEDESLRKAFEREAALLANLRHPALPRVIDHFNEGNGQFLVMEFIPGEDLEEMLKVKGGAFSTDEVLVWADQLLDALDYLHTQEPPIIHRDIKPQNLKLTARGQIILLDFGLAKGSAGEMSQVAGSGSVLGYTPTYAPMEQIHGTGTDPRSDLYSLAATLYHFITGVTPPDALSRASAVIGGQPDPLLPAHQINPQVPPAVAAVLTEGMALHSEQRPATANAMRTALGQASRALEPALSSSNVATVIVPQADAPSAINQSTAVQSAAATVIDAPRESKAPLESSQSLAQETQAGAEGKKTTPVRDSTLRPEPLAQPARRTNRTPLIIGGLVVLLVAGIVIALLAANNSGSSDPGSNKAATSNTSQVNVNSQSNKQTASPSGNGSGGGASQQSSKPEPTPQEKRPEIQRPGKQSPPTPIRDRIRDRIKARRGY